MTPGGSWPAACATMRGSGFRTPAMLSPPVKPATGGISARPRRIASAGSFGFWVQTARPWPAAARAARACRHARERARCRSGDRRRRGRGSARGGGSTSSPGTPPVAASIRWTRTRDAVADEAGDGGERRAAPARARRGRRCRWRRGSGSSGRGCRRGRRGCGPSAAGLRRGSCAAVPFDRAADGLDRVGRAFAGLGDAGHRLDELAAAAGLGVAAASRRGGHGSGAGGRRRSRRSPACRRRRRRGRRPGVSSWR